MKKLVLATLATATLSLGTAGVVSQVETTHAATQSTNEVYNQFIKAGGTKAMWDNIVMPESGGNPKAVNPAGYRGLGQTKEAWGTGTVEEQTKGMIQYAKKRYGSVEKAVQFHIANGWW